MPPKKIPRDWWLGYPVFVFLLLWSAVAYAACIGIIRQGSFLYQPHRWTGSGSYVVSRAHHPHQFWLAIAGTAAAATIILIFNLWSFLRHRRITRESELS